MAPGSGGGSEHAASEEDGVDEELEGRDVPTGRRRGRHAGYGTLDETGADDPTPEARDRGQRPALKSHPLSRTEKQAHREGSIVERAAIIGRSDAEDEEKEAEEEEEPGAGPSLYSPADKLHTYPAAEDVSDGRGLAKSAAATAAGDSVPQPPKVSVLISDAVSMEEPVSIGHGGHMKPKGQSSNLQTFTNSVVCFVGSGALGLPFAFQHVGALGGVLGLLVICSVSLHCMYLMVDIKHLLKADRGVIIRDYADIGYQAFGVAGQVIISACILLTQTGFCIAYLIFISESMREVQAGVSKRTWIILCMPILVSASWLRSLKAIAKLSLIAMVSLITSLFVVLVFDLQVLVMGEDWRMNFGHSDIGSFVEGKAAVSQQEPAMREQFDAKGNVKMFDVTGLPYFFGIGCYCFEGIGMVLPVFNGMKKPENFKLVWGGACSMVALLYAIFGLLGYMAFKTEVADKITTNLPTLAATSFMKASLCIGLLMTYPLMCVPVIEEAERRIGRTTDTTRADVATRNALRAGFVFGTGVVAYNVPRFGVFISLVGASASAALAFVLPALCYLKLNFKKTSTCHSTFLSGCVAFGFVGGVLGTLSAVADLRNIHAEG